MLNGGGVQETKPGTAARPRGAIKSADNASTWSRDSWDNTFLLSRIDVLITSRRWAASSRWVARLHRTVPTILPPPSASLSVRRFTGTIAIRGVDGSLLCSRRYARNAPAHMARTTSLTVTPAALLTFLMRSSYQDCAAHRRAPPMGTLNMVRGATKGSVSCCSSRAARASLTGEPSAATDASS